ncbi:MAG: carboxypeptidase-like regulatory domain-containing protein [Thermogutta sp.]
MKSLQRLLLMVAVSMLVPVFWIGCARGPAKPKTYSVTGTVTLNGQPVEGATVVFVPKAAVQAAPGQATESGPRVATGETDAQGRYQLSTFSKGDGAVPGEYLVKVFKYPKQQNPVGTPGGAEKEEYQPPAENVPPPATPRNLLPERYANENTSGLSFTVEAKANVFDIQLTP